MATRSLIGKLNSDNTITNIYCHWDGYPQHNGIILQEHYDSPFKVEQLLGLGNLSWLGEVVGEKQDFNDRSTQKEEWCLAYGRDRGEPKQEAQTINKEEFFNSKNGVDYLYVYNLNNEWECYSGWDFSSVEIN